MKRTVSISLALAALGLAGCGGSGPAKLSRSELGDFNQAASSIALQCTIGALGDTPIGGSAGISADEPTMSADVTTLIALYKRSDPNVPVTSPSGRRATIRQQVDDLVAGLQSCDPTLGERLQAQTQ